MFRFLSLLSYERFHSKPILSVPRIMQLSGGLLATGKDAHTYGVYICYTIHHYYMSAVQILTDSAVTRTIYLFSVLPTLPAIVEDLFLSKERMNDNARELETQKEVLINLLLRLIQYHQVIIVLVKGISFFS